MLSRFLIGLYFRRHTNWTNVPLNQRKFGLMFIWTNAEINLFERNEFLFHSNALMLWTENWFVNSKDIQKERIMRKIKSVSIGYSD